MSRGRMASEIVVGASADVDTTIKAYTTEREAQGIAYRYRKDGVDVGMLDSLHTSVPDEAFRITTPDGKVAYVPRLLFTVPGTNSEAFVGLKSSDVGGRDVPTLTHFGIETLRLQNGFELVT